jgi:hypothetical protein
MVLASSVSACSSSEGAILGFNESIDWDWPIPDTFDNLLKEGRFFEPSLGIDPE